MVYTWDQRAHKSHVLSVLWVVTGGGKGGVRGRGVRDEFERCQGCTRSLKLGLLYRNYNIGILSILFSTFDRHYML